MRHLFGDHSRQQAVPGLRGPQGWTRKPVERTAPVAVPLYSLVVLWFVQSGHRMYRAQTLPWYAGGEQPSFRAMLATLRRANLRELISSWRLSGQGSKKALQALENAIILAI